MTQDTTYRPSPASYAQVIAQESARAADALDAAAPTAPVPSCGDWSAADLAFHLGEVQDFWSQVVGNAPVGPDGVQDAERPPDGEVVAFLRTRTRALLAALAAHDPQDACWSWSPTGGTVSWVLRRQAHEALVHRVDAEQAAGLPVGDPGTALAADGVDEMLTVMVSGLPPWATFDPDGQRVRLHATDAGQEWVMAFGRFRGTSPTTGTQYDDECAELVGGAPWEGEDDDVAATVSGAAWDLGRWLWGRATRDALALEGDAAAVDRLRSVIVDSTQ
ncbi:maleylpyruvate isomerase N-terminal domain-containing protein [Cellulomonas fengjieae]|uniref:maleylpyruvate isomerase N-terminal domain-containing protein n=1 Tax=Cellulomonas fengjieae TaxID=2819978 RepID=UPI001AAF2618|nr:maleylpyruvate isomerase family mycothiol-dependent enzyme [Cellulomonas fengjieae]MBO3101802.1 maleylpyruvate isomerase family mycothiol-dependent enzyme [Cellulomonas fengjieae]